MRTVRDKSVVHFLFTEIGPAMAERNGGYTRIVKIGPRKGDNAPMAVIQLVMEPVSAKQATVREAEQAAASAAAASAAVAADAQAGSAAAEEPVEAGSVDQPDTLPDQGAEVDAAEADPSDEAAGTTPVTSTEGTTGDKA